MESLFGSEFVSIQQRSGESTSSRTSPTVNVWPTRGYRTGTRSSAIAASRSAWIDGESRADDQDERPSAARDVADRRLAEPVGNELQVPHRDRGQRRQRMGERGTDEPDRPGRQPEQQRRGDRWERKQVREDGDAGD